MARCYRTALVHARDGRFAVSRIERGGVPGLELIAADRGPGLSNPARALQGNGSTSGGLGSGIAGARRLSDELDFDIRMGEGTCIRARKFSDSVPYRSQIAILGRPLAGEAASGDDALFARIGDRLLLGIVDGLGHGPQAHDAAMAAVECLRKEGKVDPVQALLDCDRTLVETRGAVMAVAHVDLAAWEILHAAVGDTRTHVYRTGNAHRFSSRPGILGSPGLSHGRIPVERVPFRAGDVLVMFTDGLTTHADLSGELSLLREHPVVIAESLLDRFGRANDDALVLVAR